jgi:hypothetical protein
MKHIYTTLIVLFTTISAFAGTINAITNSPWENTSTWNLNRIPQNGDSIIIPANITATLDQNIDLNNVIIIIAGTLELNNGKIKLGSTSRVIVQSTGIIKAINSDDQIVVGTSFKFKGTQLQQTGYSYADATTGNAPNGFSTIPASTLPVTFQSFYVNRQGANIQLAWVTSQEVNNQYYAVEKSTDARSWKQVAIVMGAGTTNLISKYSYTDKNVTDAVVYYRIKQTDMNGDVHYSAIRTIKNDNPSSCNIYASSKQTIIVDLNSEVKENLSIHVVSMNGQIIKHQNFNQASYRLTVNIPNVMPGVYAVQVSDGNGFREVKKITL